MAMDDLMQLMGALDEVGRNNLMREKVAGVVGWDQVDRYVPRVKTALGRPVIDSKVAALENAEFEGGHQIDPAPGENHAVHAQSHVSFMSKVVAKLEAESMPPEQAAQIFAIVIPHTSYHIEELGLDPTRVGLYKDLRKAMNRINGFAQRLHQKVTEMMQAQKDQMENDARTLQQTGGQVTPEMQMKIADHSLRMQQMHEMGQMKMQLKDQDVKQRMALRDLQSAQKLQDKAKQSPNQGRN
jgi:hypothetical protein